MRDFCETHCHRRGLAHQSLKQVRLVELPEEHHAVAADQLREIALLERGPEHEQIVFDHAYKGLIACAIKELFNVIPQPKPVHMKGNAFVQRKRVDEFFGFFERLVSAVQGDGFAAIGGYGYGCDAGFGGVGPIRRCRFQRFDRGREPGVVCPERREVGEVRSVVRQNKTNRWIRQCSHNNVYRTLLPERLSETCRTFSSTRPGGLS